MGRDRGETALGSAWRGQALGITLGERGPTPHLVVLLLKLLI